jgi:hypothetical protein
VTARRGPRDLLNAEGGARIIAVATGRDSVQELRDAGALHVVIDLTDTQQIVDLVRRQ